MAPLRDIAVVAFAQSKHVAADTEHNEVEILMPVVSEAIEQSGIARHDLGFVCSGSCDYLIGAPFSFVSALDAIGAWPPVSESHVEMDAAWALYEAWVRLQHGDIDSALVYGFGKSSLGDVQDIFTLQLDPYYLAPLWPDTVSLAALQARAHLSTAGRSENDLAQVVARSRKAALDNPNAVRAEDRTVADILAEPTVASPLRPADCPPVTDGAAAIVLAAGDLARQVSKRPAWIRGIDHRIETHSIGARELAVSSSTSLAGEKAGAFSATPDVAELHAQFSHEELILRDALGLDDVTVNPSGGPLAANPIMATGLIRIGEAASRISHGGAGRALAHATSGPCLQQNLVCVLEGD
jgi:acetyl-CoA acetyltransferase